jgi:signal transduction histidine kinase
MQSVDVHECIMEILSVLGHLIRKNGIELVLEFMEPPPVFTGDPDRIGQVVMNLVLNAVQAMQGGGRLTVGTSVKDGFLQLRFEDTGTGIHKKDLSHIFEPFYTTKKAGVGTGLGLSVSYGIIKQHGGELTVSSIPGRGSVFTVSLPLDAPDRERQGKGGEHADPADR